MNKKYLTAIAVSMLFLIAGMSAVAVAEKVEKTTEVEKVEIDLKPLSLPLSGGLIKVVGFYLRASGTGTYDGPVGEVVGEVISWNFWNDNNAKAHNSWPAILKGFSPIQLPPLFNGPNKGACGPFFGEVTQTGNYYTIRGAYLSGTIEATFGPD